MQVDQLVTPDHRHLKPPLLRKWRDVTAAYP